jgi:Ca2+/H+ antiporter
MNTEGGKVRWYLKPISVILLLFFVLGPFALPLLYRSPRFTKGWKIILTIATISFTAYLVFVSLRISRELFSKLG